MLCIHNMFIRSSQNGENTEGSQVMKNAENPLKEHGVLRGGWLMCARAGLPDLTG